MTDLRDRYFLTLGFSPSGALAKPRIEAALARAYQLRSFEIEHYWRRATYFWGFQIAIFAAFGFLVRDSGLPDYIWNPMAVALPALGVVTACANSFSARGSKFWQENWERHIDMLEDSIEGSLHKMVWLDNGKVRFSVSGVNKGLSDILVAYWGLVAFYAAWNWLGCPRRLGGSSLSIFDGGFVLLVILLTIVGIFFLWQKKTSLHGWLIKAGGDYEPFSSSSSAVKTHSLVRRYAPDEVA